LLIINKKEKRRLPTVDEFLQYQPKHAEMEWTTNSEELVEIKVPKFATNIGKSFCKITRKEDYFTANMDKLGSLVWKNCNGKNRVQDILEIVKKEFPKEKNIDQRLFLFLQQLQNLHYINF